MILGHDPACFTLARFPMALAAIARMASLPHVACLAELKDLPNSELSL